MFLKENERAEYNIRVNIIAPGPAQSGWIDKTLEDSLKPMIPLEKLGEPSDIADAVLFMASDQARWITGQKLMVNGGFRILKGVFYVLVHNS